MKIRFLMLWCSLCALLLSPFADGAQPAVKKRAGTGLTAEQIVAKNVNARGGLKRWRAIRTMSMTGNMDAGRIRSPEVEKAAIERRLPNMRPRKAQLEKEKIGPEMDKIVQLPFVMELARTRKMRLELIFQKQTAVQVFDGVNGWKVRPFLGRSEVEPYTPDEMKAASQQQDLDGALIDYARKGTKVKLEGMEQVEGSDAYKLRLTLKNGAERYIWVDARTFLEVKMDGSRRMDGKPHQVATYFRDYKTVGGVKIPFLLETSVEGIDGSEKIIVDHVTLNPKLTESRFAKPEV